jgi:hypothetical protein
VVAEVEHHHDGGHRWTVITTNNPDPRVRERIAFIDADELTALIARVQTAEKAIREVLQAKRGLQITYCDEVNARMGWARRAGIAEERAETAEAAIARVRQLRDVFELNARTIDGVAGRNFFELFVEELDEALDPYSLPPETLKEEA